MLTDSLVIEFAKFSDAAEISRISRDEIEHGLPWSYTSEKLTRLMKDDTKNVVVARIDNQLIGFGIMTYHQDQANLDLLAVKTEFRRQRIGSRIVLWLEKTAVTADCLNIFVQVRQMNTEAIRFYEGLGFQQIDIKAKYYQDLENAVIMAKLLRFIIHSRL